MEKTAIIPIILALIFTGSAAVEIGPGARIFQYDQSSNINFSQARNFSSIGVRSLTSDFGSSNFTVEPENSASAELEFFRPLTGRQNYVSNFTGYASPTQEVSFNISDLPSNDFYEAFFSNNDTRIFIGYALQDSFDFNLSLSSTDISVFNYGEKGVAIKNVTFNDSNPVEGEELGVEQDIFNEGVVDDEAVNKTLTISTYNGSGWEQKEFRSKDIAVPINDTETELSFTSKFQGSFKNTTQYRNGGGQLGLGYQNGTSGDDLIGYWRLDQAVSGSGGPVEDFSGNNNDGTTYGGIDTGSQGILGTESFRFDANDDRVKIEQSLVNKDEWTFTSWYYDNSSISTEDYAGIISNAAGDPTNKNGITFAGDTSKLRATMQADGSFYSTVVSSKKDEWIFAAAARNSSHLEIRRYSPSDGYAVNRAQVTPSDTDSFSTILIGKSIEDFSRFDNFGGRIDEARYYSGHLTEAETDELYLEQAPFRGNYTTKKIDKDELTHWYRVNLNASIPSGNDLDAEFRALDSGGNVVDTDSFKVEGGDNYYNVSVQDSYGAELYLNGSSENLTKSWEINKLQVISGGPYVDPWEVKPGPWRFNVSLDPEDEVKETNESNNQFEETLDVDSYQIFHGETNSSLVIGNDTRNIYKWNPQQNKGYIFFSDVDSSFLFSDLEPVNGSDLVEVDEKLNLSGHNDSTQELWDRDGDGVIDRTNSWDVGERTLDVPVTNSTEDSPFDTGILYDSGDGQGFDGSQDIVLMTRIQAEKTGKYGTYDYESRIPFSLDSQEPGSDLVDLDLQLD